LYRGAEIGVGEIGTSQLLPGGNALQEYAALLCWQAAGRNHDDLELGIG
jgi:hypothetical protein